MFDRTGLLAPISEEKPCGPLLSDQAAFHDFSTILRSTQRPDWARLLDKAITLAGATRDLKAWVWLTRASLSAHGVPGLADGLELIAEGLKHYWDVLPPLPIGNEDDPRERSRQRLTVLTELGATNYDYSLDDFEGNRILTHLRADLDEAVARAPADSATVAAVARVRDAAQAICRIFLDHFGADYDPQIEFDVVLGKLAALESRVGACAPALGDTPAAGGTSEPAKSLATSQSVGVVASPSDVVRAFDFVLAYYESNEPSSAVPLLVQRAKRLVRLSFVDAMKELAPSGLKDLQQTTGFIDEET